VSRLAAIERTRLREQLDAARAWLVELESEPLDDAMLFAIEQTRRNIGRLQAAVEGRTPSAVTGRNPQHPDDDDAERLALARDEGIHAAENVLVFVDRFDADDERNAATVERCARWLLRLRLELLDALPGASPDPAVLAFELLRAEPQQRLASLDTIGVAIRGFIEPMRS
jgi:hypothetical protein